MGEKLEKLGRGVKRAGENVVDIFLICTVGPVFGAVQAGKMLKHQQARHFKMFEKEGGWDSDRDVFTLTKRFEKKLLAAIEKEDIAFINKLKRADVYIESNSLDEVLVGAFETRSPEVVGALRDFLVADNKKLLSTTYKRSYLSRELEIWAVKMTEEYNIPMLQAVFKLSCDFLSGYYLKRMLTSVSARAQECGYEDIRAAAGAMETKAFLVPFQQAVREGDTDGLAAVLKQNPDVLDFTPQILDGFGNKTPKNLKVTLRLIESFSNAARQKAPKTEQDGEEQTPVVLSLLSPFPPPVAVSTAQEILKKTSTAGLVFRLKK